METRLYRLSEIDQDGWVASETFEAPNDVVALSRALDVCAADILELWRGSQLVARIERRPLS